MQLGCFGCFDLSLLAAPSAANRLIRHCKQAPFVSIELMLLGPRPEALGSHERTPKTAERWKDNTRVLHKSER